jgi:large subunit ribosomal protein L4
MPDTDNNLVLSSRNLKKAKVTRAEMLNTYDILNANNLLIAESSVPIIEEILGK